MKSRSGSSNSGEGEGEGEGEGDCDGDGDGEGDKDDWQMYPSISSDFDTTSSSPIRSGRYDSEGRSRKAAASLDELTLGSLSHHGR